jgi:uncharacterized protein YhaN
VNNKYFIESAEAETANEANLEIDKYTEKQMELLKNSENSGLLMTGDEFFNSVEKGSYTDAYQQIEKYASKRLSHNHHKSAKYTVEAEPQEN